MFFLFLGKNFLEKVIFYLGIFFQVHYGYTKKNFLLNIFSSQSLISVKGDFLDQFLGYKTLTYTHLNTVILIITITLRGHCVTHDFYVWTF